MNVTVKINLHRLHLLAHMWDTYSHQAKGIRRRSVTLHNIKDRRFNMEGPKSILYT
jgi:hypothetical protein